MLKVKYLGNWINLSVSKMEKGFVICSFNTSYRELFSSQPIPLLCLLALYLFGTVTFPLTQTKNLVFFLTA